MKTNPLTSRLRNCPGTSRLVGAFKEVRSEVLSRLVRSRTIASRGAQPNSPAPLAGRGQGRGQPRRVGAHPDNTTAINFAKYLIPAAILILLLLSLVACKAPATLTNNESHRTRDSNYHATVHRIETHDTIVIRPSKSPLKGDFGFSPFKGELERVFEPEGVLLRISNRTITIRDTVFIARTDTLLRTQTITQKERYIPPFYRFCTITLVTLITFVTLAFSIHLLLRYLKIRSPT